LQKRSREVSSASDWYSHAQLRCTEPAARAAAMLVGGHYVRADGFDPLRRASTAKRR
jgi:hypothetical protein